VGLATAILFAAFVSAAVAKDPVFDFCGSAGTGQAGQCSSPRGLAINTTGNGGVAAGTVYVGDFNNNRIQSFTTDGVFLRAWGKNVSSAGGTGFEICTAAEEANCKIGEEGSAAGELKKISGGLAVDQATGNVYVVDRNNNRVQEFGPTGAFIRAWGKNVSSTGGTGAEICTAAEEANCKIGENGTSAGTFTFGTNPLTGLGIDSGGNVYVTDSSIARVQKFDSAGNFLAMGGKNVVASGPDNAAEIQKLVVDATGGTFTLSFGAIAPTTTGPLAFNASAATVQAALAGLGGIGAGNVAVAGPDGGPWTVRFVGSLKEANQPNLGSDQSALTGDNPSVPGAGPTLVVSEIIAGGAAEAYEVCDTTDVCQAGVTVGATGPAEFSAGNPSLLAASPTGDVYAGDAVSNKIVHLNSSLAPVDPLFAPAVVAEGAGNLRSLTVENSAAAHLYFGKFSSANIYEVDPHTQAKVGEHVGGQVNWIGLAVRPSNGRLYAANNNPLASGFWIRVLADLQPAVATLDPVTGITATSANVSGTVDPQGGPVTCKYQFSEDAAFSSGGRIDVTEPQCGSLVLSGGPQPVGESISGLLPNTHYFARLVVSRLSGATVTSASRTFDTVGVPPVVSNVGATDVQDTSARFVGTIDPRHSATAYVFEYGTTLALGSTTPGVDVGGGATPLVVSMPVGGLSPNTTYFFRLSATNQFGTTSSGSSTLKTRIEPSPPGRERKYEQVTPSSVNNVDAGLFEQAMMTVARDGDTVGVCNFYAPEGEGTGLCGTIANSRRTAAGWQFKSMVPPTCARNPLTGVGPLNGAVGSVNLFSANLDRAIFARSEYAACPFAPVTLNPAAQTDVQNFYRGDFSTETYDLLAPNPTAEGTVELSTFAGLGASDDFDVVFYQSQTQQTVVGPAAPAGSFSKLYEWDHGTLRLASVKPPAQGGTPFTSSVGISYGPGAVSETGSRVFFQSPPAPDPNSQLYMREGGSTTYEIGQTECTTACGSTSWKAFATASEDGSMAFFETPEKLSDEDSGAELVNEDDNPSTPLVPARDLYLYRHSANPGSDRNLWVLTRDDEPADGTSANLRGELGHSEDGTVVFFATSGQIVPGATTAPGFKLYRWRWNGGSPTVDFLANLDGTHGAGCISILKSQQPWADEQNWTCEPRNLTERFLPEAERIDRVAPDGGQLTIDTIKALDPVADADSTRDVYTWDEVHGWRCVSCQAPEIPSAGESVAQGPNGINSRSLFTQNALPALITSSDGKQIFFTSQDQLVPGDTNGTVSDVYEWNNGTLNLISSGTSDKGNLLVGTTPSGDDVFFVTAERLVGWDTDDTRTIYDARVGGGFPEPPLTGSIYEGKSCRGAGTGPPTNTGAGTAAFQGPGNSAEQTKKCPRGTRKVKVKGKQVCKKTRKRHKKKASHHKRAASNHRRASR
jgi:hypothetical protein